MVVVFTVYFSAGAHPLSQRSIEFALKLSHCNIDARRVELLQSFFGTVSQSKQVFRYFATWMFIGFYGLFFCPCIFFRSAGSQSHLIRSF